MSTTDINEHRWKRHCSPIAVVDGVDYYNFCVDYKDDDGLEYGFHLSATSFEDAERRLKLISNSGEVVAVSLAT